MLQVRTLCLLSQHAKIRAETSSEGVERKRVFTKWLLSRRKKRRCFVDGLSDRSQTPLTRVSPYPPSAALCPRIPIRSRCAAQMRELSAGIEDLGRACEPSRRRCERLSLARSSLSWPKNDALSILSPSHTPPSFLPLTSLSTRTNSKRLIHYRTEPVVEFH